MRSFFLLGIDNKKNPGEKFERINIYYVSYLPN